MDADTIDEVAFFDAIEFMIKNTKDNSLVCELLTLPSERALHNHQAVIEALSLMVNTPFSNSLPASSSNANDSGKKCLDCCVTVTV
jgi:hypothetical protein